jgi:pimeloyl-ACP methyl ester carboxylesterase
MPKTGQPFPAVILITGSGQQDRDESVFGHRPFLILADYLTRRGLAVLRVDDRGVGGSKGDASQATSVDFAQDVLAGVEYLKTRQEIDPRRIGLIGHSEGGIIAPIVATQSSDVAFIVLMAGTGVPGDIIIEKQIAGLLQAAGTDQAAIDTALQNQRRVYEVIKTETDPNLTKEKIRKIIHESAGALSEEQKKALQSSDAVVDAQAQGAASPWFRFFVTHDPKTVLRRVKCPVLAINGQFDRQVLPGDNLPAIEEALREGGNTHFTVKELPGLNHLFQTAQTGNIDEYARMEETIAPLALETMAQWIEAQTQRK